MSLSLNFLPEPVNRRLPWLVLALGVTAVWTGADTLFAVQDELSGLQQEIRDKTEVRRSALRPARPDKSLIEADTLAKSITAEIRYSWSQVLRELEASYGEGVLLKAFEHNQLKAATRMELQADTPARFQEVVRRLKEASGEDYAWKISTLSRDDQGYRIAISGYSKK